MVLVGVTLALLTALVWALNPTQPGFTPAPLRPQPPGCPKISREFMPTNITDLPDLPLQALSREQKNWALLRMNLEPCPCGCGLSLAACRVNNSTCEISSKLAKQIVVDVKGETPPLRRR